MALTVSSIVGNTSGFIKNDRYNSLSPAMKTAVESLVAGLDAIDWSQPQDLVNIIETKISEVAAGDSDVETALTTYFSE
tara:strand:+ start:26 stop:262 length:237 start_codon:yes stop_codon:yes gene_type:complete